jgi:hypothetical protein
LFLFLCLLLCASLRNMLSVRVRRAQNLRAARLVSKPSSKKTTRTPQHAPPTQNNNTNTNKITNSNAAAEAALLAEIDALGKPGGLGLSLEDLDRLPYTAAVIDEALRLGPPGAAAGRVLVDAGPVGGYELPAGASVMVDIYTMHR